jgi:hypothetical protein
MNEIEIKFYSHLGKLSTLFSRLEYLIREITGLYIVKESHEDMVYLTIIGKNSLEKNTALLKELAYISSFGDQQRTLLKLIGDVNNIRKVRNLFIHGLWDNPTNENGDIFIVCNDKSFKLKREPTIHGQRLSYNSNVAEKFNLSAIKKHIKQLEKINSGLNLILQEIEEDPSQYF